MPSSFQEVLFCFSFVFCFLYDSRKYENLSVEINSFLKLSCTTYVAQNNIPIINDIEKPVIAIIFIQIFRFIFCDDIIREEPTTIDARTKLSESFVDKSVIHRSKLVNFISSICILILLFSKFLSIVFNCF